MSGIDQKKDIHPYILCKNTKLVFIFEYLTCSILLIQDCKEVLNSTEGKNCYPIDTTPLCLECNKTRQGE